jgi:hypothetical protein
MTVEEARTRAHEILARDNANRGPTCNGHAVVLQPICDRLVAHLVAEGDALSRAERAEAERDEARGRLLIVIGSRDALAERLERAEAALARDNHALADAREEAERLRAEVLNERKLRDELAGLHLRQREEWKAELKAEAAAHVAHHDHENAEIKRLTEALATARASK